jgi:hypothetical protein
VVGVVGVVVGSSDVGVDGAACTLRSLGGVGGVGGVGSSV